MKIKLAQREKALLVIGISVYEKLATSTKGNLDKLNLSTMAIDTTIGDVESLKTRLGAMSDEVELGESQRIAAADALSLMEAKVEKVKGGQEELLIPTEETEVVEGEVRKLNRRFSDQLDLDEAASS